jgi:N-carbamoyl-L-amino-acid hydrolase
MVFIPSKGGRSHCPEEFTEPADVAVGAQVLAATLAHLDETTT